MKISIIGAGNGGQAMAGHFALLGHDVTLYNRSIEKLHILSETKEIHLSEAIIGVGKIKQLTDDLATAVTSADIIMIATTANAHKEVAEKMVPFLEENQIIVLNPGRTLGAIEVATVIRKQTTLPIYIAEAQSLIYACRAETPGKVKIIGVKDKVMLAAYPNKDTEYVLNFLNKIYPCFIQVENCLRTSLENIGAILHPAVILFNAATIERGSMFYFYNDMTPSIANFLVKIDKERLAIGKAFGMELLSVSDWISYAYKDIEGDSLCDKMRNNPAYYKIKAPNTLQSRLLLEDVPTGILPLLELSKIANVETPLLNSVLHISQTLLGIDFIKKGRTLKNLGLDGYSLFDFKNIV